MTSQRRWQIAVAVVTVLAGALVGAGIQTAVLEGIGDAAFDLVAGGLAAGLVALLFGRRRGTAVDRGGDCR